MTTYNVFNLPDGMTVEIRTNVGASPIVRVNGVIQSPADAQSYMYLLAKRMTWQPTTLWIPRKINGRWYWLTKIYRREKNKLVIPHQGWEYGDEFDILKDS